VCSFVKSQDGIYPGKYTNAIDKNCLLLTLWFLSQKLIVFGVVQWGAKSVKFELVTLGS
tara:strand:+ start:1029 stop:1205 length:177 start_codon:yes stop_codon:yes gene_type:complete